jgi:hypothetical protein
VLEATAGSHLCSVLGAPGPPHLITVVKHHMIGELTSIKKGPERNVKLVITPMELQSQISEPPGTYDPSSVDHYEVVGLQQEDSCVITLTFILADRRKVLFYSTRSKLDMVLLLDQLDGTIGTRHRVDPRKNA